MKALSDMSVDELADHLEQVPLGGELELENGRVAKRAEHGDPDGWEFAVGEHLGLDAYAAAEELLGI